MNTIGVPLLLLSVNLLFGTSIGANEVQTGNNEVFNGKNDASYNKVDTVTGIRSNTSNNEMDTVSGIRKRRSVELDTAARRRSNTSYNEIDTVSGIRKRRSVEIDTVPGIRKERSVEIDAVPGIRKERSVEIDAVPGIRKERSVEMDTVPGIRRKRSTKMDNNNSSLLSMVLAFVSIVPKHCLLVLVDSESTESEDILRTMTTLMNPKVIISGRTSNLYASLSKVWSYDYNCVLNFYFGDDEATLKGLLGLSEGEDGWSFKGWHIGVGWSKSSMEKLSLTSNMRRTPGFFGILKVYKRHREEGENNQVLFKTGGGRNVSLYKQVLYSYNRKVDTLQKVSVDEIITQMKPKSGTKKMMNLEGAELKVITFEWKPSVLYKRTASGEVSGSYGIDIEVVKALADVLNFKIEFEEPPPGEFWGARDNNTWTGMVGLLNRNEADLGIGNLFLTLMRKEAVDYSAPYDAEVSCFMARIAAPLPRWQSLTYPFSGWTWLATLIGTATLSAFLAAFTSFSDGFEVKRSALETIIDTFGSIFREPMAWVPFLHSTRFLVTILWIFGTVISTGYSSNLTALLTVTKNPKAFETVRELYETNLPVASLGPFFGGALASAVDPYLKGLSDRFVPYDDLSTLWPLVSDGGSVYLHNKQFLEYTIATEFTSDGGVASLRIMKQCFAPYSIALALQRNSPLKEHVDRVLGWMLQSGLVRYWFLESLRLSKKERSQESKEEENMPEKTGTSSSGFVALSLDHLSGSFLILSILILTSIVVFAFEIIIGRCNRA